MLIGIVGTLCAGKHTTAEYLVQHHGFLRLHLPSKTRLAVQDTDDWKRLLPSVTDEKGTRGLTFPDVDALLEFVTKRWTEHWVLTDIHDETTLDSLLRRPFFLLLGIDAPMSVRFKRFNERCTKRHLAPISMETFVHTNDTLLYSPSTTQQTPHFHLQILNHMPTVPLFHHLLSTLDLASPTRLRPPWDTYFMHLAHLASLRSNCMKRRVGCVLIHNNRIISTGYNGTPRGLTNCNEGGCARCNSGPGGGAGLSTCLCLHAEENALLEAGRERIREGSVLYCDTCPCLTCSVKIAQVGVKEVVYSQGYNMDEDSRRVLAEAGVELRQFSVPRTGLVGLDFDFDVDGLDEEGNGDGRQMVVRNAR